MVNQLLTENSAKILPKQSGKLVGRIMACVCGFIVLSLLNASWCSVGPRGGRHGTGSIARKGRDRLD